ARQTRQARPVSLELPRRRSSPEVPGHRPYPEDPELLPNLGRPGDLESLGRQCLARLATPAGPEILAALGRQYPALLASLGSLAHPAGLGVPATPVDIGRAARWHSGSTPRWPAAVR